MKLLSITKAFGLVAVLATASSAVVLDDFSGLLGVKDGHASDGKGYWAADTDSPNQGTSKVLIETNGQLYPAGTALDIAECPTGDSANPGVESDCYWGWNTADAYTAEGFKSILEVTAWVPSSADGWGWAAAGWYYIFDGEQFTSAAPAGLAASDQITFSASYDLGKQLTVSAYETSFQDDPNHNRPQMKITGTGAMKDYVFSVSDLQPASWATNTLDVSTIIAFGFLRSEAAATQGAEFTNAGQTTLIISKLECSGSCGGGGTTGLVNAAEGSTLDLQITTEGLVYSGVSAQTSVEIFNLAGESVVSEVINGSAVVSTQGLDNGAYIVRTSEQGKSAVAQRFVVSK